MFEPKNKKQTMLLACTVLVVFHVIILFLPLKHNLLFWLAYGFDLVAIVAQAPILSLAFKNGKDAKSRFYGFPIMRVGMLYLLIQFVVGTVVMVLCEWVPLWLAIILFVLVIAFAVVGVVGADTMRDEVVELDVRQAVQTGRMRELTFKAQTLSQRYTHPRLKALAEALRYSDPVSQPALDEVEERLTLSLKSLEQALEKADASLSDRLVENTFRILDERNRLCKQMKGQ